LVLGSLKRGEGDGTPSVLLTHEGEERAEAPKVLKNWG